ncbi:MAG TPA: pitrilysin family protein [Terriglobia bacterium]
MRVQGISRTRSAILLLLIAVTGIQARPQEGAPPGAASTRGDRHSEGWSKAMRLKGPPLPPKFPKVGQEIERAVLENGMIVYLQEDHRLPLLDVSVLVRTGTYYEPAEDLRTAALAGELLRRGGTKNYPPDALEERLDFIVANLSVAMSQEQCSVSLNVPAKDAEEGLRILADVLRNPVFDESRLELAKRQAIFSLRSSNDSPGPILQREFRRLLYTDAHPAGRVPTIARIEQIQRDNLVRFHQKFFHPNQVMLGLTGDFNKAEMLEKVRELFGDWPRPAGEVQLPPLPKVNPQPKPGVYYVAKEVNQSNFWLAHWGTNRDNPDRFAIDLMNDILGGSSFSSRLAERVRNDEGLAYSVGSSFVTSLRDINFFLAAAQTRTDATVQAIRSILDEVNKMRTGKISKNEFDTAKEMFLYSQVFRFDEPAQALEALMELEYEGLPSDHLEKEFAGYQAVTAEDIERVARQYLKPDQLTIFIVGNFAQIAQEAAALGPVHEVQPFQFE